MYIASVPVPRAVVERSIMFVLIAASVVAVLTTVGIVLSLIVESIQFFRLIPVTDFLFGLQWSPQTAIRSDQVGASGAFGAIPLLVGTLLISAVALTVSGPVGLLTLFLVTMQRVLCLQKDRCVAGARISMGMWVGCMRPLNLENQHPQWERYYPISVK